MGPGRRWRWLGGRGGRDGGFREGWGGEKVVIRDGNREEIEGRMGKVLVRRRRGQGQCQGQIKYLRGRSTVHKG